jgi:rhomboid protease GluP
LLCSVRESALTAGLVAANFAIWVGMLLSGTDPFDPSGRSLLAWGANYGPLTTGGQPWRLLTCAFVHGGYFHLMFNIWVLWDIGRYLEVRTGHLVLAAVYAVCALGASIASLSFQPYLLSVGASGAIFGLFGFLLGALPRSRSAIRPDQVKGLRNSALAFIVFNVAVSSLIANVDHFAHFGGLATGAALGLAFGLLREPVSGSEGPISGSEEPVSGSEGPVSGSEEPVSGSEGPVSGSEGPVSGSGVPGRVSGAPGRIGPAFKVALIGVAMVLAFSATVPKIPDLHAAVARWEALSAEAARDGEALLTRRLPDREAARRLSAEIASSLQERRQLKAQVDRGAELLGSAGSQLADLRDQMAREIRLLEWEQKVLAKPGDRGVKQVLAELRRLAAAASASEQPH